MIVVKGTLTHNGTPLQLRKMETVEMIFYPVSEGNKKLTNSFPAVVKADASFVVSGRKGRGIAPGKYRIAIKKYYLYPSADEFRGAFDAENSPIVRDVTSPEEMVIDVAMP